MSCEVKHKQKYMPRLVSQEDLRLSAAEIVLKLFVMSAVLLPSVMSNDAQAMTAR